LTDEFQIGAHHYRAGRLSAKDAFHVARRLGYVLTALGIEKGDAFKPTSENFARIILVTSGQVPQADMDFALNTCLGVVKRRIGDHQGWAAITTSAGAMMYDDIDMSAMLQIVWHVISAHRLPDFLFESGSGSAGQKIPA
jgi:hypothetical protein